MVSVQHIDPTRHWRSQSQKKCFQYLMLFYFFTLSLDWSWIWAALIGGYSADIWQPFPVAQCVFSSLIDRWIPQKAARSQVFVGNCPLNFKIKWTTHQTWHFIKNNQIYFKQSSTSVFLSARVVFDLKKEIICLILLRCLDGLTLFILNMLPKTAG